MASEFHFFPLLPWELRNKIWKLAIRPALPGAHVFRVYNADDPQRAVQHETLRDEYPWRPDSRLAAPRCLPKGVAFDPAAQAAAPISWTLNNPSTYLIDGGLWTACKESLLVIEKEFQSPARRQKVWSLSELECFRKERGRFTLPETATYTVSDNSSRRRHLTVFPGQDLFILQPHDLIAVNWDLIWACFPSYIPKECFPSYIPEKSWLSPVCCEGQGYDRHIALEYDPAWDKGAHNPDPEGSGLFWGFLVQLIATTAMAGFSFSLWFIDYRIKRNPGYQEPTEEQGKGLGNTAPRTFYASDRRFVEVQTEQLGDWAGHKRMWDTGHDVPIPIGDRCWCCREHFVDRLRDELEDKWSVDEKDWIDGRDYNWIEYGLLACEHL